MADNPMAFPSPDWNGKWEGPDANHGMSLRDWFVGHIAAAAVGSGVPFEPKALARDSFMLADAMLAEREGGK